MGDYQSSVMSGRGSSEVDWKQHRVEAKLDPRLRQLRLRNLLGHTFSVYVDLREDVSRLAQLFALREGLGKMSHVMGSLRFVFDGIVLEPDVPLVEYGIMQGSMIQTRICPRAWRGDSASECSSEEGREHIEPVKERRSVWIKVPLTVVTPFGEAKGALEIPEPYWPMCRLTPKTLNSVYCLTDTIGVNGAFTPGRGIYWQLRLDNYMPYPCMQQTNITDVWKRLSSTFAHVEVEAPSSCQLPRRHIVNEDDLLPFASIDSSQASEMHLKITLLSDSERTVSDSTAMFRETEAGERTEECCCICLETMRSGEWCRRLPCLHRMHAGCCMLHLPSKPSCPVCRTSLNAVAPVPSLPSLPPTPENRGTPQNRRTRHRPPSMPSGPSTPTLPSLPRTSGSAMARNQSTGAVSRSSNSTLSPASLERHAPIRGNQMRSPVPRLVKALSHGLKTIRARSWSQPRVTSQRVLPGEL